MAKENFYHLARHDLNLENGENLGHSPASNFPKKTRFPSQFDRIRKTDDNRLYVIVKELFERGNDNKTTIYTKRRKVFFDEIIQMAKEEIPRPYGVGHGTVMRIFKTMTRIQIGAEKARKSKPQPDFSTDTHKPRRAAAADKPSRK